jgi:single-strand DNA-binding protein
MNNVTLIGRPTKDPDYRKLDNGTPFCKFTLAVDDKKSKDDRADFISITTFGPTADYCEKYIRKGLKASLSGRLRADRYTDSEGVTRYPVGVIADHVDALDFPEKEQSKSEPGYER